MFENKKPTYGDQIRVNRKMYYHYGIYVDDSTIINFASKEEGHELDPNYACVCISNLQEFLKGGNLEVRTYSEEELKIKRSPQDIVNYAFLNLGRKGYNLISNNCEHFANECVFGKSESLQVNNVKTFINNLFNERK